MPSLRRLQPGVPMTLGRNSRNLSVSVRRAPRQYRASSTPRVSLRRVSARLSASVALAAVLLLGVNDGLQPASAAR